MIKLLVKLFIKDYQNTNNQTVREKYGILGGILGIICNLLLFGIKLVIGIIVGAVSITSDAFNNLTDSMSSIIGIISAKLSNKKPDKQHPFGHGRIEYISTLIVSFIIMVVGFELFKTSGEKILIGIGWIKGEITAIEINTTFYISIAILSASLLVKLWMYSYNRYLGKKINSNVLLATATDSLSDVLTSAAIIVTFVIGGLLLKNNYFYLDAIMGLIVSIIIFINGLKIVFKSIGDLLGKPASKEQLKEIEKLITDNNMILGIHDLLIHDYGPGRVYGSVHAEIDSKSDIIEAHEIIDEIEHICYTKLGIELTIHMDPIDNSSPAVTLAKQTIEKAIQQYKDLSFHDLRITNGDNNINVIFDLVIPYEYSNEKISEIISNIKAKVKEINPLYSLVIKIDRPYIEQ